MVDRASQRVGLLRTQLRAEHIGAATADERAGHCPVMALELAPPAVSAHQRAIFDSDGLRRR